MSDEIDDGEETERGPGRPPLDLDKTQLEMLAKLQCTYEEIAAVMGCSVRTLERNFVALIEKGREDGKASLRRMQFKKALEGNPTMLIWLGKQHLNQADQQEIRVGNLNAMSDDELRQLAAGKPITE